MEWETALARHAAAEQRAAGAGAEVGGDVAMDELLELTRQRRLLLAA